MLMLEQWLAGVLDFNGSIGIRTGARQIQPYIAIYTRHREYLEQLREVWPGFSPPMFITRNVFMSQIVSIRGTLNILEKTQPYLNRLYEIAETVIKFCRSRLEHINVRYTIYELQLVEDVLRKTARPATLTRRLEVLEQWR